MTDSDTPALPMTFFLAVAVVGGTAGFITGLSESPVVGAVVPGVLVLLPAVLGGLVAGKKESPPPSVKTIRQVSLAAMLFCGCILLGGAGGVQSRITFAHGFGFVSGPRTSINSVVPDVSQLSPTEVALAYRARSLLVMNGATDDDLKEFFSQVFFPSLRREGGRDELRDMIETMESDIVPDWEGSIKQKAAMP